MVAANNVYAHVPDLLGFTRALRTLMADDGWLTIEVHHALHLVTLGQFDTIYHEHFQYYTVLSITRALATAGLTVVDVDVLASHGGSIRVWAQPEGVAGPPAQRWARCSPRRKQPACTTWPATSTSLRAPSVQLELATDLPVTLKPELGTLYTERMDGRIRATCAPVARSLRWPCALLPQGPV